MHLTPTAVGQRQPSSRAQAKRFRGAGLDRFVVALRAMAIILDLTCGAGGSISASDRAALQFDVYGSAFMSIPAADGIIVPIGTSGVLVRAFWPRIWPR